MDADPVGRWITEKTGVTIEVDLITGDINEKYSLMLATHSYPDFLDYGGVVMERFISEGALIPYDEYLNEDILPNVISKYGMRNLNALRNLNDGKLYRLTAWSMGSSYLCASAINIRHDIMQKYFGERAHTNTEFTTTEIADMFEQYKKENPQTADGAPIFPLTDWDAFQTDWLGRQLFGVLPLYEVSENNLLPHYFDPNYRELIKWLNGLYRNGLLDPEFAINKLDIAQSKLGSGSSIAIFSHVASMTMVNAALSEKDPEAYMFSHYNIYNESTGSKYLGYSTLGGGGLAVTKNCKDIDRAMEWIDFMNEPYTNFVAANGYEGGIWDFDENGNVIIHNDKVEAIPEMWERYKEYGAYKYVWMLLEGRDPRFPYDDDVYKPMHAQAGIQPKETIGRYTFWDEHNLIIPDIYNGLDPEAGSEEAIIQTAIADIWKMAYPKMVMASSENEALALLDETLNQIRAEGLDTFMAVVSKNYAKKKALMYGD